MSRIALMAVDSDYPNLALMKIAAYHKRQGDVVEWYNPFDRYDTLYMSKIFGFTPDYPYFPAALPTLPRHQQQEPSYTTMAERYGAVGGQKGVVSDLRVRRL